MQGKENLVSIIILNWNGYKDTIDCMKSVLNSSYDNYRIVICDNASTDESVSKILDWARPYFDCAHINNFNDSLLNHVNSNKKLTIISNSSNLGFSGGNNVGIEYSLLLNINYIWILNNDTIIENDSLCELMKAVSAEKSIGIVGSKIYFANSSKIWFAGGKFVPKFCQGKMIGYGVLDDNKSWNENKDSDFITGCSMLIKAEVIESIGLFDSSFFFGMEDIDFGLRAKKNQYKIVFAPKSKIEHKVSASTGGMRSPTYLYHYTRNYLFLIKKHCKIRNYPLSIACLVFFYFVKQSIPLTIKYKNFGYISAFFVAIYDYSIGYTGVFPKTYIKISNVKY